MKSYSHLWEQYLTKENARIAINNMAKGKKKNKIVAKIVKDVDSYIPKALSYAENFIPQKHHVKEIYDGIQHKKRIITVPRIEEQIVHHMIINILAPIFQKSMYEHCYASLPGGGIHHGAKQVRKWINNDRANTKYYLKLDVKSYFANIDRAILYKMLKQKIHDKKFLDVLRKVIMCAEGTGIPLGFYTSQWFANFYLTGLDHYIKNELKAKYYIRYMDDMVIFNSNKRKLRKILNAIKEYLAKLNLKLKNNYQLARFHYVRNGVDRGKFLDFLGFRFYRNRVTLRRKLMLKISRKAKRIAAKNKPTVYDVRQFFSYYGWIKHTNSRNFKTKRIDPYINIKKLKQVFKKHNSLKENDVTNGMATFRER